MSERGRKTVRPRPPTPSRCQNCASAQGSATMSCASERKTLLSAASSSWKKEWTSAPTAECAETAGGSSSGEPRSKQCRRPKVYLPMETFASFCINHWPTSPALRVEAPTPKPNCCRNDATSSDVTAPWSRAQPHRRRALTASSRCSAPPGHCGGLTALAEASAVPLSGNKYGGTKTPTSTPWASPVRRRPKSSARFRCVAAASR
mmetsp:Transcript_88011/g.246253  ORF Transcript_88011/g.246253 Transcript_88011/m.246253 type:complete len:205 (+) Transcript_88011:270-884(+)